ncbi:MAG: dihydroorotase, partial [Bacteroidota bacterium]
MSKIVIKNAQLVNRGIIQEVDVLVKDGMIAKIAGIIDEKEAKEVIAEGKHVLPGIIDDQVHFREPGLTHKACIETEARAAVAGGVTSFMEMPNTKPTTTDQPALAAKYEIGRKTALANYSFFMGATNDNLEEVLKTNGREVCGVKIFMGSSTGNMLVDETQTLDALFREVPILIATHCEDEQTIRANAARAKEKYGEQVPIEMHPIIRNVEGCLLSSQKAVALAKE